jgi:ATPase subunit of ABC transporter with duplicated ATPase domains
MPKSPLRIVRWSLLIFLLVAVLLALHAPRTELVAVSLEAAKSFDEKITAIEQAHQQKTPRVVHITETELSSKLQQSIEESSASSHGSVTLTMASVHLEDDRFVGLFTLNVGGKELYLTMVGTLGALGGRLQIRPSEVKLGTLPVPMWTIHSLLQRQFDSPASREQMQLPTFVKDVRIKNGELLVEAQ